MADPEYEPKQGDTTAIFVIGEGYDELKVVFDKIAVTEQIKTGFKTYMICLLEHMVSYMINMAVHWIFKGDKAKPAKSQQ